MNNTFDIKRFGLLVKKDFAESWKKYLMAFLAMFGITTILFVWVALGNYYYVESKGIYSDPDYLSQTLVAMSMFLALAFACICASWLMDPICDKTKKISYLTNPASQFEKYLMRWGLVVVLFIAAYLIAFFAANFVQWLVCTIRYPGSDATVLHLSYLFDPGSENSYKLFRDWDGFILVVSFYFFMQSLFVLGSTFWQKNSFVKTFCAGLIIFVIYLFVCWGLTSSLFDRGLNDFGLVSEDIINGNDHDRIPYLLIGGFSFFAVFNWVIGYLRFREIEIAKRI